LTLGDGKRRKAKWLLLFWKRWLKYERSSETWLATSIVHDKEILGGEPVIEGTRTPVRAVIEYLRLYGSKERVLEALPHLTADQLEAAIAYYEIHPEEVEAHIWVEAELDRELERDPDVLVWEATSETS